MPEASVVKLRLALMGRPVRNYTFDKQLISVGRDPESDVFVDNPGVSREHFRLERTPSGQYQVVDLGSANGTFLNDAVVRTATVRNNDVVRFGKYTLWVGYDHDRRAGGDEQRRSAAEAEQHTMVLSRAELTSVLAAARERETHPAPAAEASSYAQTAVGPVAMTPVRASTPMAGVFVAFLIGTGFGAAVIWLLLHR